jgi:hypothetical protein
VIFGLAIYRKNAFSPSILYKKSLNTSLKLVSANLKSILGAFKKYL